MTEAEARTKWCPMVRLYFAGGGSANKIAGLETSTRCIASDCMAWRSETALPGDTERFGYCGLAGRARE